MRRIITEKMHERQELMDRESIFQDDHWEPPKTWSRTHGLLSDIRQAQRHMDEKRLEYDASQRPPEASLVAQPPLDLPVPQTPAGTGRPATPSTTPGGTVAPSKPTIIER